MAHCRSNPKTSIDRWMRHLLVGALLILLASLPQATLGQNLVGNYSFEDIDSCQLELSMLARGWSAATVKGTPDLFNRCSTDPAYRVPSFFQCDSLEPATGDGFAGVLVFGDFAREYLQAPLMATLDSGTNYYVAFHVSPTKVCLSSSRPYTDGIGLAFSPVKLEIDIPNQGNTPLDIEPIIERRGEVVNNVHSWLRLSNCYTANGSESYVLVGNFMSDDSMLVESSSPLILDYNYLFIDDVIVAEFNPLPDTTLMCEDELILDGTFLDASLTWSTGQSGGQILITQPGIYSVRAEIDGCTFMDTTLVIDIRSFEDSYEVVEICPGETEVLNPGYPGIYEWSDGSAEPELLVGAPGLYSATITNKCRKAEFEYEVTSADCECSIFVANVFSPNGDGVNDVVEANFNCPGEYTFVRFSVFDRWGNQVFSSADALFTWDGTSDALRLGPGVYVWLLEYAVPGFDGLESRRKSGDITLLR